METTISDFCKSLATFCNHVESTTRALSASIERRPIPLDSAASAFLQSLDRRISSTGSDLNLLESMAMGTVSFEELIGHVDQLYRTNDKYIADIEDRMKSFGYVPGFDLEVEDVGDLVLDSDLSSRSPGKKELDDHLLFEDSPLCLHNLGLSDACLATLASEGDVYTESLITSSPNMLSHGDVQSNEKATSLQSPKETLNGSVEGATIVIINASKGDYDSLPSYVKGLASWEELQQAVVKVNDYLCKKKEATRSTAFKEVELEKLGLGHKWRSFLLLLVRMRTIVMETTDGSILYHVNVESS